MEVGGRCGGARAFFDAAGRRGRRPLQGKANWACHPTLQAPQGEDFRVTFFYKPIDIVGFMCYHALTYKKDMLKE